MKIKTDDITKKIEQIEAFASKLYANIRLEYIHYKSATFPFSVKIYEGGKMVTALYAETKSELFYQLVGFGAGLGRYRAFRQK